MKLVINQFKSGGLEATGILGTISAFAYIYRGPKEHRETKKAEGNQGDTRKPVTI